MPDAWLILAQSGGAGLFVMLCLTAVGIYRRLFTDGQAGYDARIEGLHADVAMLRSALHDREEAHVEQMAMVEERLAECHRESAARDSEIASLKAQVVGVELLRWRVSELEVELKARDPDTNQP